MKRPIILLLMFVLVINTIYFNYKYKEFYKNVPEEINIEAVIISNSKEGKYYNSYTIKGKNNIFKNKKFILYTKNNLVYGDKIKVTGTFLKPSEQRNYKGFNYKKHLQTQGIYGSIKPKNILFISKNNVNTVLTLSYKIRNKIIKNIQEILPKETSGLLIGILLGDKTYLEEEIIESFQKSSLAHILAVSGAHVSYIILGITFFISINKMSKKCGYLLIILVLIIFLFLTNFSLSVVRACIMAIILIFLKLVHRRADVINTLTIAILITIIYNPYSIYSISFQLSYLGTIGVIYISPIINKLIKKTKANQKILQILSVPITAQISILPIIAVNFNTTSFTFLISNVIAMPLLGIVLIIGIVMVPISFLWMWGAQKLGLIIHLFLKIIILVARLCGNIKLSNIYVITPSTITILIYYFSLLTLIYVFNLKKTLNSNQYENSILNCFPKIPLKKIIALLVVVVCLIEFPYVKFNGKVKIYFIDVGQRR